MKVPFPFKWMPLREKQIELSCPLITLQYSVFCSQEQSGCLLSKYPKVKKSAGYLKFLHIEIPYICWSRTTWIAYIFYVDNMFFFKLVLGDGYSSSDHLNEKRRDRVGTYIRW